MYFLIVRRRKLGVAIPTDQLGKIQALKADIHIGDHHSAPLGRMSTQAWVFTHSPGADIIPRLHDAKASGIRTDQATESASLVKLHSA